MGGCRGTPLPADFAQCQCRLPFAFLPALPCLAPSVSRLAHHRLITSFEVLQNLTRCIAPKPRPSLPLAFPSPALFRADDDGPVSSPPDNPFLDSPSAATVDPSRRSHGPNALGACCREGSSTSRVPLSGGAAVSGVWSLAPSSPLAAPHPPKQRCLWLEACLTLSCPLALPRLTAATSTARSTASRPFACLYLSLHPAHCSLSCVLPCARRPIAHYPAYPTMAMIMPRHATASS